MKRIWVWVLLVVLLSACVPQPQNGPIEAIDTGQNPDAWAKVPAGTFLYGMHEVTSKIEYTYEIMVTDVTNGQFAVYLNQAIKDGKATIAINEVVGYYAGDPFSAKKHEEQIKAGDWLQYPINAEGGRITYDGKTFAVVGGYENHPMTMVTWFGGMAYCQAQGGRLPTEVEWEKAARGTGNRPFPWGESAARNQANFYSSHDLFEKMVGGLGNTTPVGFYNGKTYDGYQTLNAASPYGLYDMAGNVWQWTANVTPGIHYRYLRGGSKSDYAYNLRVWTRNNARPDYYSPNVGFRCVRGIPKP